MSIRFSVNKFPCDIALRDSVGTPWGCVVQPFAQDETANSLQSAAPLAPAAAVARCDDCFAYINFACHVERYSWRCVVCDMENSFNDEQVQRYGSRTSVGRLEEMKDGIVELDVAGEDADSAAIHEDVHTRPVYIAVVDLSGGEEFLELVKSALLAALEALPPAALFGLVTVAHKVGLYDVQGQVALVKHVSVPADSDGSLPVDLEDVMPLEALLAPVEAHKERLTAVLETLRPSPPWEHAESAGQEESVNGSRGFGSAMDALLKYLGSSQGTLFVSARLFAFLSGPPDFGAGVLNTARYSDQYASRGEDADKALLPEQTPFYRDLAGLAVQCGVCIDLFLAASEYSDLASLKFLSTQSGGSVFLYRNLEECSMPQDIYRMLSRPHAFGGVLRLRTSPEFKVSQAYGHFFEDKEYEQLHHIISCDQFDTYAYDFDFTQKSGFGRPPDTQPVVQMAFQYTVMLPVDEDQPAASTSGTPTSNGPQTPRHKRRYVLRRRMRIRTLRVGAASNSIDLMESTDPEVVLSLLTHRIIQASLEDGVREARSLIQDWLVLLEAQYNEEYKLVTITEKDVLGLDVAFTRCSPLQPFPRLIFALLRSPLLRAHEEGVHPDARVHLQCLYTGLEPSSLLRAIYPVLSSFSDPDKQAYPRHSLSRAALVTSGSPIFLLDAFTTLVVYYAPTAPPDLPFPPPQQSLLRSIVNRLKLERSITPRLIMVRGGHDSTEVFERLLIEEQDVDGTGQATGMGFLSFLDQLTQDVKEYLAS